MKLLYAPGACSLATHIVLEWIGQPFETQAVQLHPRSPELLEANPAGAVPVLEVDGWILTQNTAILNYLADTFPDAGLGGDGTAQSRAEINRWLGFVNSDIHPVYKPLFGTTSYLEDEAAIEKTKANAKEAVRTRLALVDKQIAGRNWVVGTRSMVDPYLYVMMRWANAMQIDLSGLNSLPGFVGHMEANSGVQKALEEEGIKSVGQR